MVGGCGQDPSLYHSSLYLNLTHTEYPTHTLKKKKRILMNFNFPHVNDYVKEVKKTILVELNNLYPVEVSLISTQ